MKIARDNEYTGYAVRRYDEHGITLSDERTLSDNLILTMDEVLPHWRPQSVDDLRREDFSRFAELKPQVALLGTGRTQRFPPRDILRYFARLELGLEVMDTAAACRTFNVLVAEGRRTVMGLIMERR